jgi:transglutaminase-like putative cysteine protease
MDRAVYRVEHDTRYRYAAPTPTSRHVACLRPRDLPRQRVLAHALHVEPAPSERRTRRDWFGNALEHFTILGSHRELFVRAESVVEVVDAGPPADDDTPWEAVRDSFVYAKGAPGRRESEFLFASPFVVVEGESLEYAKASFPEGRPLQEAAFDLMHRMHEDFRFDAGATTVTTPVTRVLAERRGVCQDLAHVMISCLRAFGLPARYVSGYLLTDPPPGQPRLLGADASHAWVAVHIPGPGWVDLDPTNDVAAGLRHVVTGWGRDYGDVCPLRGVFTGGGEHQLEIGVSVHPLDDAETAAALREAVAEPALAFAPFTVPPQN